MLPWQLGELKKQVKVYIYIYIYIFFFIYLVLVNYNNPGWPLTPKNTFV